MRLPFFRSKSSDHGAAPAATKPSRRKSPLPPPPGDDAADVQTARTRARQRLVGALVLLAIGVLGFPVLFETQPRPVAVDTPIEIVPRDAGSRVASGPVTGIRPAPPPPITLPPADAGNEAPAEAPAATPLPPPRSVASAPPSPVTPAVGRTPAPAAPPAASAAAPIAAAPSVAAPVAASTPAGARFVVQVGAFTEARALREARQKVEGLGLKTYTQVIDTEAGKRTRVRVGPFETRAEAEAAAKKIKTGGLPAAILAL